ncbi:DUF3224 domain-containing protein [Kitasatospora sp. NPDC127111]|uniref:DUF3224 domain-containing protein n=1 Tax=Kitasatospora sp. NPDC127111 TaxID=3345363 RepID=UPI0036294743
MGTRTSGAFEVTAFEPEETDEQSGATLGRVRLTKEFTGGLTGGSVVRMLSVLDGAGGPAAYVAVEHFTGELDGRKGSFVLQHAAPGSQGERLAIRVVAGTGAGELTGLTGTFELTVDEAGRHAYTLDYALG